MPKMQALIERLNAVLSRDNIDQVDADLLAPGTSLAVAARKLVVSVSAAEARYIASWPQGQQEAVRAALYSALARNPRLPVTMSWAPGYDFEISIWEAAGTRTSIGGMTIVFRSRYPGDRIRGLRSREGRR